ncbi:hypothetical protein WN51_07814 [Melipona quadrifasciata]|uniref:Uncharacterized protein n=1 Tax=Melipona quadrifasciata TaxID=166423 RepID=A0A0M9A6T7_9HYME|nr:hypothetical protein WN51_07814 [Melipona quadrifasciata]
MLNGAVYFGSDPFIFKSGCLRFNKFKNIGTIDTIDGSIGEFISAVNRARANYYNLETSLFRIGCNCLRPWRQMWPQTGRPRCMWQCSGLYNFPKGLNLSRTSNPNYSRP